MCPLAEQPRDRVERKNLLSFDASLCSGFLLQHLLHCSLGLGLRV